MFRIYHIYILTKEEAMGKAFSSAVLFLMITACSVILVDKANATNDKGQLVSMCKDMVGKKGVKDSDKRTEFMKCMRDPSGYK
jgi:hypothetical protein